MKKAGNLTLLCYDEDGGKEEMRLKARYHSLVRVDGEEAGGGGGGGVRTYLCTVHSRRNKISPVKTVQHKPDISPRYQAAGTTMLS